MENIESVLGKLLLEKATRISELGIEYIKAFNAEQKASICRRITKYKDDLRHIGTINRELRKGKTLEELISKYDKYARKNMYQAMCMLEIIEEINKLVSAETNLYLVSRKRRVNGELWYNDVLVCATNTTEAKEIAIKSCDLLEMDESKKDLNAKKLENITAGTVLLKA